MKKSMKILKSFIQDRQISGAQFEELKNVYKIT